MQECAFCGSRKTKFYISTQFSTENGNFGPFLLEVEIFASEKRVNRQIVVGELKYGVTVDSLFTDHVTQPHFGPKIGSKRP